MTKKVLEKIEGTNYKITLEQKRADRKRLKERGHEQAEDEVKASIAGYVQALRDCGVITERERQVLFIYYGTV
jgi:hypothetical protein